MAIEGILYSTGQPVSVSIEDGKILKIYPLSSSRETTLPYIAPGLIDIQINGYMGIDFTNPEITTDDLRKVTQALRAKGVTTFLPTVITSGHEHLVNCFESLSRALEDSMINASIPGFHLEGPYISPEKGFRGAHLEKYIRLPDYQEFMEYQHAANNGIIMVAIAPEIIGAIDFIEKCVKDEVVVTLAHHNGNAEEIAQAVDAGASISNHLGNGCANMINRHHNPLWPQLAEDRLVVSIIADGFHLTQEEIQSFYKIKGDERTILVSDAVDLAGLPPGEYVRWERTVVLTPDVVKFPAENVLAGAASPISKCVGNMMRFTNCSLESAINMASRNPAWVLGLDDVGEILEGKRADLILFTLNDTELVINKTFVSGVLVYQKYDE
ncbi:MAG: amidohydrolase family protein [Deltaproteobacteria bacterium]|nr:amidohydrolase family protein [Deltaproteobacteria bacterium]